MKGEEKSSTIETRLALALEVVAAVRHEALNQLDRCQSQLLLLYQGLGNDERRQHVADISEQLKKLAKTLDELKLKTDPPFGTRL